MSLPAVSDKYSRWYFYCLVLFALSLPFSKFSLSVSQFLLLIIWVIEGRFIDKWRRLIANKIVLALIGIYLIHLLGLLHTEPENMSYAMKDLRVKLPILSFSVFASWIFPLKKAHLKKLSHLFILAAAAAALIGSFRALFLELEDLREASLFVSHIRLSLMIVTAAFICLYYLFKESFHWLYAVALLVLISSLFIMGSMTGIVILLAATLFLSLYFVLRSKRLWLKVSLSSILILGLSIPGIWLVQQVRDFNDVEELGPPEELPYTSPGGEIYYHKIESSLHENGTLIWSYVALKELKRCWERKSDIGFEERDAKGQPMYSTIMRYMSSKALHKDSVDFQKLSDQDIRLIEQGHTNYRFIEEQGLKRRVYETLWEIENLKNGNNPEGNSIAQRAVFWSTGWEIFKRSPIIGIGTGDIKEAFKEEYERNQSELSEKYRHRTHNQYLSIAIAFGAFGLLFFIFSFYLPVWLNKSNFLMSLFLICISLSFIPEDTMETQVGVSYLIFFYCLFALNDFSLKTQQME